MHPRHLAAASPHHRRTTTARLRLAAVFCLALASSLQAADFTVTSSGDQGDGNPGNGFCGTSGMFGVCTLRAAVEESNALAGPDRIFIGVGTITLASELSIEDDVEIDGAGADSTVIQSDGGAPNRLFHHNDGGASLTLTDLTLRGGDAGLNTADGGALRSVGDLTVERVWFDGNIGSSCGALRAMGTTVISDSTFTANSAAGSGLFGGGGGAICVANGSDTSITNTTFVGNSALFGGAVLITHNTTNLTLFQSTLVDNIDREPNVENSNAIDHQGAGDLHLSQTLIAGECLYSEDAVVLSDGGNIESPANTCLVGALGDQPNQARMQLHLGSLGAYGGPVPTILPGTQSVAVDPSPGLAICTALDARGEPRVNACDVGAVERQLDDPESGPLFEDGFESGDTMAWTSSTP